MKKARVGKQEEEEEEEGCGSPSSKTIHIN